jgi:hypothetical protein
MKDTSSLEFTLEENAIDSLRHGAEHFLDAKKSGNLTHLKYTILHTFHSTELFLKAVLCKAHPTLIFQKPEDASKDDPKTVDFETLLQRLTAVSVIISKEDIHNLNHLRKFRNRIEHHKISFDLETVQDYVAKSMRFLHKFIPAQLFISLKNELSPDILLALEEAIYSYEERLNEATRLANENEPHWEDHPTWEILACPNCGEPTIRPEVDVDGECSCLFCHSQFYLESCSRCQSAILYNEEPTEDTWQSVCNSCMSVLLKRD